MAVLVNDSVVDAADAYFSTRLNSGAWNVADESTKLSALVTAANLFNSMTWAGRPATTTAPFPRYLDDNRRVAVIPQMILWALFEQAIHFLNNPGLLVEEETVQTLVVGPIELQDLGPVDFIPKIVKRYIAPYTSSSGDYGGNTWWRAN